MTNTKVIGPSEVRAGQYVVIGDGGWDIVQDVREAAGTTVVLLQYRTPLFLLPQDRITIIVQD